MSRSFELVAFLTAVFDARSPRRPLAIAEGLEDRYPDTNVVFSPDGKSILTGLPPANPGEKGAIVFLDATHLTEQRRIAVAEGTVIRVLWHTRINQVSPGDQAVSTLILDHRNIVNRSDSRAILPSLINSWRLTSLGQDQEVNTT